MITQGSRGVSVCRKNGEVLTVPARPAIVADTTGAGDTLNGAFSVQIAKGEPIAERFVMQIRRQVFRLKNLGHRVECQLQRKLREN